MRDEQRLFELGVCIRSLLAGTSRYIIRARPFGREHEKDLRRSRARPGVRRRQPVAGKARQHGDRHLPDRRGCRPVRRSGQNGAEITIEAINAGTLPAPYNTKGFAGASVEPVWVDESGGNAKQVADYRNLVEKRNVDVVLGYISSGTCAALSNVVEELKRLTVYALSSTPRVFDDADRRYIFRPISILSSDAVAAARYLKEKFPKITSYAGIHPNYAWGQDSARDFEGAVSKTCPNVKQMEVQFPKLSRARSRPRCRRCCSARPT